MADFHIHSTFSDGVMTIPEVVDFYGARGFGAIAITDHLCEEETFLGKAAKVLDRSLTIDSLALYRETLCEEKQRAWEKYRMVLLPGFEFTRNSLFNHRSAHILGIGIKDFFDPSQEVVSLIRSIKHSGGIAVAAHPVDTGHFEPQTYHLWSRREELAHEFDAWEVASGPLLFKAVFESKLPKLASSDLHHPRQMSSWKTVMDCERPPEVILNAIREQKVSFRFYQDPLTGNA